MRWRIIAVLAILLIAIILTAIIIAIINAGDFQSGDDAYDIANLTAESKYTDFTVKSKTSPMDKHFHKFSTISTTVLPMTKLPIRIQDSLPIRIQDSRSCDSETLTISSSCPKPKISTKQKLNEVELKDDFVFNTFRPTNYLFNISIPNRNERRLSGKVIILLETLRETKYLLLQTGPNVEIISDNDIFVSKCEDGSAISICVESVTRFFNDDYTLLILSETLASHVQLRIGIDRFETSLTADNAGLVVQQPQHWERDRAWMVGTLNVAPMIIPTSSSTSKSSSALWNVLPLVAFSNSIEHKASFKLCFEHPNDAIARSNMPKRISEDVSDSSTLTCFRDTPLIPPNSFAFVVFDNLQVIANTGNEEPIVEAYIGKHLKESQWIIDETYQILDKMAEISRIKYPLERLVLVSSPLSPLNDGTAALGLIHIKETWIEHPKYAHTHTVLIAQLVRQWLANTVTFCDKCIQDGLATYLEWQLSAELQSKVAVADEFSTNTTRRFIEARNRLLQNGGSTSGVKFFTGSLKPTNDCADRVAVVMFMLENTYSRSIINNFISVFVRENAWKDCISNEKLSNIFRQVTGDSTIAKQVFDTFVSSSEVNKNPPPIVNIDVTGGIVKISQQQSMSNDSAVPIQLTDDSQHRTQLILMNVSIISERPTKFVIAEPNSYVRHVYNPENYENILECYGRKNCPSLSFDAVSNALNDLCWALLSDQIQFDPSSKLKWHQLFDNIVTQRRDTIYDANCLCCMQGRPVSARAAQCRWTWRDTCSKLSILKTN